MPTYGAVVLGVHCEGKVVCGEGGKIICIGAMVGVEVSDMSSYIFVLV